jgi:hypothetical protein
MGAEGGCEPFWGSMNGAGLAGCLIGAARGFARAPVFEPLAAVLVPEHVRSGFNTHAGLTASDAPRCMRDH